MALPLPSTVKDPIVQQVFNFIAQRFPIGRKDIAKEAIGSEQLAKGLALLLASTGTERKVAFGKTEAEYPGASNDSNEKSVTHGLGTTPAYVFVSSKKNVGDFAWYTAVEATTLKVGVTDPFGKPALGTKTEISWLVIG